MFLIIEPGRQRRSIFGCRAASSFVLLILNSSGLVLVFGELCLNLLAPKLARKADLYAIRLYKRSILFELYQPSHCFMCGSVHNFTRPLISETLSLHFITFIFIFHHFTSPRSVHSLKFRSSSSVHGCMSSG